MPIVNWEDSMARMLDEVAELVQEPREDLEAFYQYLVKERELRGRSILTYGGSLLNFARWWKKPLDEFAKDDAIENKHHVRGEYEAPDLQLYGPRMYLKWRECRDDEELMEDKHYLPTVAKSLRLYKKASNGNGRHVRETPILKMEEIARLIDIAQGIEWGKVGERDAVMIGLLYSTGFRKGEILSMQVGDLYLEDGHWYARCRDSKTIPRKVRLHWGEQYAEFWKTARLEQGAKPEDPLWLSYKGAPYRHLDYSLRRIVEKAPKATRDKFARAGRLCHLFRHTRATHLAAEWKDPWRLKEHFGWSNLNMANEYVHYVAGEPPERPEPVETMVCEACGRETIFAGNYCRFCGAPVSREATQAEVKKTSDVEDRLRRLEELVGRLAPRE